MDTQVNRVCVVESRPRDHVHDLSVRAGDVVGVGHRNQQYPEMRWCTSEQGHSSWMAESYFEYTSGTEAIVTRDYDASQLTVIEDEELEVLDVVGEWRLCRNDHDIRGWVPHRILEDIAPHRFLKEVAMTTEPHHRRVRVVTSCMREQVQEIRFRDGDSLSVGHRNQQHPAFIWAATEDGHHGWVPEEYVEMRGASNAVARRGYDSTHLTVGSDETLEVLEQVGDYLLCRNAADVTGWVPEACVEDTEEP